MKTEPVEIALRLHRSSQADLAELRVLWARFNAATGTPDAEPFDDATLFFLALHDSVVEMRAMTFRAEARKAEKEKVQS
jgi:hypothetical protein